MRATAVLQKLLQRSIPSQHAKRLATVTAMVGSALRGGRLTLSGLARSLDSPCAVRHRIKRVDRLLANPHLSEERLCVYRMLCDVLVGTRAEPVLIVDWSDLKPDRSWLLLRASVWLHGFALPIYEEVHPLRLQNNRRVQREFLLTLRMLLNPAARPIVVADAGFRSPWLEEVERLGWHWVGRIRGRTMIQIAGVWRHCKTLFPKATGRPEDLGSHAITRSRPVIGRLCRYRKPARGRHHITLYGQPARGGTSRKNARREREPWLIAASLSLADKSALDLINLYRVRMRIEHSFRTLKSHQFGFSFEDSQTRRPERLAALLLIHALALLLAWIAGVAAQRAGMQRRLNSNAIEHRATLSIISLGWMALTMIQLHLSDHDVAAALALPATLPYGNNGRRK
ncbi:MAG TPA: IS4 family transposase [Solimonas sp.]|nr:IS4 family transposase [Solimonas sp.]